MKDNKMDTSRRRFLNKGIFKGVTSVIAIGILWGVGIKVSDAQEVEEETVKMLSADGELVEINKSVFEQKKGQKSTRKEEILKWGMQKRKFW